MPPRLAGRGVPLPAHSGRGVGGRGEGGKEWGWAGGEGLREGGEGSQGMGNVVFSGSAGPALIVWFMAPGPVRNHHLAPFQSVFGRSNLVNLGSLPLQS